jgi:hypothetical protein
MDADLSTQKLVYQVDKPALKLALETFQLTPPRHQCKV